MQCPRPPCSTGLATLGASALALLLLTACGGGGGGSEGTDPIGGTPAPPPAPAPAPPPPPPPTPVGTLSVPAVTIPDEAGSVTVTVSYTSVDAPNLTVSLGSDTKSLTAANGTVTFTRQGEGDLPVVLKSGNTTLDTEVSQASCSAASVWDTVEVADGKCAPKLCYKDAVTALMGPTATIYKVDTSNADPTKWTVVQATDLTGWTVPLPSGWLPPPAACVWQRDNPDAVGRLRAVCGDPSTNLNRLVYYYPTTGEMKSFDTTIIDPATITLDKYLPDVAEYDPKFPDWAHSLEFDSVWLYSSAKLQSDVWVQPKGDPLPAPVRIFEDPELFGYQTNVKRFDKWSTSCTP